LQITDPLGTELTSLNSLLEEKKSEELQSEWGRTAQMSIQRTGGCSRKKEKNKRIRNHRGMYFIEQKPN